jgi:uncharacterized RDD family membrane protein YckC
MNPGFTYASFHQRLLAWLLDLFLLGAVLSPFIYLLNSIAAIHITGAIGLILFRLLRLVLVLGVSLVLLSEGTAHFGGTPGKVLLDLQVIDADSQHWLRPRRALLRTLFTVPVTFSVLGILIMFFDAQRRTFHDRAFNTLVIVKAHDYADEALPGAQR